jgi:hypothetical protein
MTNSASRRMAAYFLMVGNARREARSSPWGRADNSDRSVITVFYRNVVEQTDAVKKSLLIYDGTRAISMRSSSGQLPDRHDWLARAAEALEKARKMKPGPERNDALKKAGQLQSAADMMGYLKSKELRPPK